MKHLFSKIRTLLEDPIFTTEFHKWATIVWILLLIPSVLFWSEAIMWVVLMSVWANIAGHWSAYQASRAELKQDEANGTSTSDSGGSCSDCSSSE